MDNKKRLIDADALIEFASNHVGGMVDCNDIARFPTVDAVEVVRCEKCYYWDKATVNKKGFLICPASGMDITPNDFCSYGERKDDT